MIQHYEQRQKNINKAQVEYLAGTGVARIGVMIFEGSFRGVIGQFSCSIEAQKYTENILNVH